MHPLTRSLLLAICLSGSMLALSGCVVIAVVDTAASLAVGAVGLVGDAAIGTVKVAGKVVGATADAVLPGAK
jgi:dolichol kinase